MKVALYHPWVYLKGGAERSILDLVTRSRHEWTIFTNHFEPYSTFPEFRALDVVELPTVSVKRSLYEVGAAALTVLLQRLDLRPFDAMMISSEGIGNLMSLRFHSIPIFCFCHTPLKIAHDPVARQLFFAQRRSWRLKAGIKLFTMVDRLAWKRYHRIFCNSEETRSRLLRSKLAHPANIEVLHPGVDTEKLRPSWRMDPYFLLPGRIMWQKNIQLGIAAFHDFKRRRPPDDPFRLIIAGMLDQKSRPYFDELKREAVSGPSVEFVISPDDQQMRELYANSYAVLSTAFNEDWGIALLEAMAFGKPVIAVNRGGPTESVAAGETGLLCEPTVEAFSAAMGDLARDASAALALGKSARERVVRYDCRSFVNRIDEYVEELVAPVATGIPVAEPEAPAMREDLLPASVAQAILEKEPAPDQPETLRRV